MARCAAEYCKDVISKENPGRRVPTKNREHFIKWMRRVGRLNNHHDKGLVDSLIRTMEGQKLCTKHFHVKYIKHTNKCVKLLPDAVPMSETEYKAHIAQQRLISESLDQQRLIREMEMMDIVQDENCPTLRSSSRLHTKTAKTTTTTDSTEAKGTKRHRKVNTKDVQLVAQAAAL